jgi:hypothetical protein
MLITVLIFVYNATLIARLVIQLFCAPHAMIPMLILTQVLDACVILGIILIIQEHASHASLSVLHALMRIFVQLVKSQTHSLQPWLAVTATTGIITTPLTIVIPVIVTAAPAMKKTSA